MEKRNGDARDLAVKLAKQGKYKEAANILCEAAESGDVLAINDLGVIFEKMKDYDNAFKCYTEIMIRGYGIGYRNLGNLYMYGNGARQDSSIAIRLFEIAGEKGNADCYYKLFKIFTEGLGGVKSDENRAVEYLKKGAKLEHNSPDEEGCTVTLQYLYETGSIVKKDIKKCFLTNLNGYKFGKSATEYNLALCYLFGKGTKPNVEKGMELMKQSAEHHYFDAYYRLARLAFEGEIIPRNVALFKEYFTKALNAKSYKMALYLSEAILENEEIRDNEFFSMEHAIDLLSQTSFLLDQEEDKVEWNDEIEWFNAIKEKHPELDWPGIEDGSYLPGPHMKDIKC